uniref:Uncharacterized protein n=1 Tax=Lepeophtheirus salmonis TaxID=72036 RepID=A0A0K2TZJ6_LEPSM
MLYVVNIICLSESKAFIHVDQRAAFSENKKR